MGKKIIRHGLAFRLSLSILTCVVIIFMIVLFYDYQVSKNAIMKEVRQNTDLLLSARVDMINSIALLAKQTTDIFVSNLNLFDYSRSELSDLMAKTVLIDKSVVSVTVAYEPYMFDKQMKYFSFCMFKSPEGIKSINTSGQNYFSQQWYGSAIKSSDGIWDKEPREDNNENGLMVLGYSRAFYKMKNGKEILCGAVLIEISLKWVIDYISKVKIYPSEYPFMISRNGINFMHYRTPASGSTTETSQYYVRKPDETLKKIKEEIFKTKKGFRELYSQNFNKHYYICYDELPTIDWIIGIIIPSDKLLWDLKLITFKLLVIGMIGYILLLFFIIFMIRRISRPLEQLAMTANTIGEGNFDIKVPVVKSSDEIGLLSSSISDMQNKLVGYIDNLQKTTAAKERIEKELAIARDIQQSLLPNTLLQTEGFDIYAVLIPAKEIGGDIYDYFIVDENTLCVAIGDVCGKGVPAALFMSIIKALLRTTAAGSENTPSKILRSMNNSLSKINEAQMFITFFLGIVNRSSGELMYSNAGHNPPIFQTKDGGLKYLESNVSRPLGFDQDSEYEDRKIVMRPGDTLFLYTDGVTEACDNMNNLFSESRLEEVFRQNRDEDTPKTLIKNIKHSIDLHTSGTPQSDDIAMLALKYIKKQ